MKTCSLCKHREQVNGWMDVCRNGIIAGHIVSPEKVGCADHEPEREPLRLECECRWNKEYFGFISPYGESLRERLEPFVGKRTKMTIEEIV